MSESELRQILSEMGDFTKLRCNKQGSYYLHKEFREGEPYPRISIHEPGDYPGQKPSLLVCYIGKMDAEEGHTEMLKAGFVYYDEMPDEKFMLNTLGAELMRGENAGKVYAYFRDEKGNLRFYVYNPEVVEKFKKGKEADRRILPEHLDTNNRAAEHNHGSFVIIPPGFEPSGSDMSGIRLSLPFHVDSRYIIL